MGDTVCINKKCEYYDEESYENCDHWGISDGRNRCKDAIIEYIPTDDDFITCLNCKTKFRR
uniref:Uncharacterized protein n=1 Tax=viral metagenome TaxID=1070528 RepID=A0A6H2A5H4_9ZZZZ